MTRDSKKPGMTKVFLCQIVTDISRTEGKTRYAPVGFTLVTKVGAYCVVLSCGFVAQSLRRRKRVTETFSEEEFQTRKRERHTREHQETKGLQRRKLRETKAKHDETNSNVQIVWFFCCLEKVRFRLSIFFFEK